MEAKSSMQVIILLHEKTRDETQSVVMHKIMNAPEGQSLQRDIKLQKRKRDAARLYLNLLECYFRFVSFFSFPFFFC